MTGTRYYWNAINKTEAHFSYKLDYTTPTITIKGGTTLWMLADDSNQSAIKNCDTTSIDQATTAAGGKCNPLMVSGLTPGAGSCHHAALRRPVRRAARCFGAIACAFSCDRTDARQGGWPTPASALRGASPSGPLEKLVDERKPKRQ